MFSIAARTKMISLANAGKLAAPAMGMGTSIDPTMPKRPPTTYTLFVKEKFAAEKARNPKAPTTEVVKALATQWNKLADANKKTYAEKAAKLRAEYNSQITDVQRALLTVERQKKTAERANRAERKEKNEGKPKMLPARSYMLFLQEKFASLPAADRTTVTLASKKISAVWRDLPDNHKAPYAARAAKNVVKNRDMLDTWKQAKERVALHK